MKELDQYRKIFTNLPAGVVEAEAEAEKRDRIVAGLTNGAESELSAADKTAVFVRAAGVRTGTTYTQNLEADAEEVLLEALKNSRYVQENQKEELNRPDASDSKVLLHNTQGQINRPEEGKHVAFEELLDKAAKLETEAKKLIPGISHISVALSECLVTAGIVNSLGLDKTYSRRVAEAQLQLTVEGATHRSIALETSAGTAADISPHCFSAKLKEWGQWPTKTVRLTRTNMEAVLDAGVICNIFFTAWQMFSGVQYHNKSTPFYNRLGETLFPAIVNISDIPWGSGFGYEREFDCEGTPCRRVDVIKEGCFRELMHNLKTARKSGTVSTGNAGRDTNLISDQTEVKVIPTHFTLLPGTAKKEELLGKLEDGIYICESYDMFHSVNTTSGDFAIPCQGIRYCGGKPDKMVKGITISGNLMDLFGQVEDIADDRATSSMVMSKSLEVGASSVYVKKLAVT